MSKQQSRTPKAFRLDDEPAEQVKPAIALPNKAPSPKAKAVAVKTRKPRRAKPDVVLNAVPEEDAQRLETQLPTPDDALADSLTPPPPVQSTKRIKWSRQFWFALTGLVSLGIGLWVDQLIRDLYSRQDWLGWLAAGLTTLLFIAAFALFLREIWSVRRMARIDKLRIDGAAAATGDDIELARSVIMRLSALYAQRPDTARGRASIDQQDGEIIDGRDLIALAERDLMKPLDDKARGLVMGSAKRVSVVTAVSPRAIVDIGFVLLENARLIRRLAELYGGHPTTLGFWRLARNVVGHLAITGTIAIGEGMVQQVIGQGLAARLSSRLGEGVVNGLLTARIGISAIDVCRPLPFSDQSRPSIKDFMGELVRFSSNDSDEKPG